MTNKLKTHSIAIVLVSIVITFFLPWIKVNNLVYNGYALLVKFLKSSNHYPLIIFIFSLLAFIIVIVSITTSNKKPIRNNLSVIGFILFIFVSVLILFSKKTIDAMDIAQIPFLIKYFSFGYWLFFVLSIYGLIVSLKRAQMNLGYITLVTLSIIWLFPLLWIVLTSLRAEQGFYSSNFIPNGFTLNNYISLLTDTSVFYYVRWFLNTLFVAVFTCIFSTSLIISISYVISRIRFRGRKTLMNLLLILGMFPGFMAMIAVYYIIKAIGLSESLYALILVYSGGSALGYYIVKGYFDTIPKALDEAALIEGATRWQILTRIVVPLSKPIIIYTILTSFIAPWADFIFASIILGDNYESYTVAIGLYTMIQNSFIDVWYTRFAAGAVLISIPIAILFISLRKYYVEGLSAGATKG